MAELTAKSTKGSRNSIAEKSTPVPMDIATRRELIGSREYKVMLDHTRFEDLDVSLAALLFDLKRLAGKRKWSDTGKSRGFSKVDRRRVVFLDTEDGLFRNHRLILRQRKAYKKPQDGKPSATFTLKCRCEDRYIAAGQDINPHDGKEIEPVKFEEDIAAPFSSRFSRSVSIASGKSLPKTLAEVGRLFPSLAKLKSNGIECSPRSEVKVVNKLIAHEKVFKGPKIIFFGNVEATIALILWSHRWTSRPIAAELSFRYENVSEQFEKKTASQAFDFFKKIQTLDWCSDSKATKTQIAYGDI